MFALTPAFARPTLSVFDDLDFMAAFGQPGFQYARCAARSEESIGNQLAINLPADIAKDQIKTTINKKTGILTVSAEDKHEKEFSGNGWTGKTRTFSCFSKSIQLPKHVMENEELIKQVIANKQNNQLKITFPEPKEASEKQNEDSQDLINIETVRE